MSDEQQTKVTTLDPALQATGQDPGIAPRLPDSQRIFYQLFECAPDGIVVVDRNGLIRQANPQTEKLFGYSSAELIGKPIEMLIPERFASQHVRYRDAYRREPRTRTMGANLDLSARRQDGTEFPVDIMLSALETKDGRLIIAVVRDITERKQAEVNYRQARDDAEAASQAKDQFIAMLSHELRTPLTPLLTAVQMMEAQSGLTTNLRERASMIRRNVELEARLIDDLLDVTKISRGKLELQLEAVDLNETLRQAMKICESEICSKQLTLSTKFDAKEHWVRADAPRLQQILWNLLKNAVKFTPSGGAISVRTENLPDERVAVLIQDSGVGIEPEMLPRLFDAFEQGSKGTTRQFGGLGLGLNIAKGLQQQKKPTCTSGSHRRAFIGMPQTCPSRAHCTTANLSYDAGCVNKVVTRVVSLQMPSRVIARMPVAIHDLDGRYNTPIAETARDGLAQPNVKSSPARPDYPRSAGFLLLAESPRCRRTNSSAITRIYSRTSPGTRKTSSGCVLPAESWDHTSWR